MKLLTKEQIEKAIDALDHNQIVILPTDTIYGLSAVVDKKNEEKINEIKQADIKKPLIILISSINDVKHDINYNDEDLSILNQKQPTTVIFPLKNDGKRTVAIRIVKRPDIKKIIDQVGPIFSTSVNKHSNPPLAKQKDLESFLNENSVFFTEKLESSPSRIYNSITKEYVR